MRWMKALVVAGMALAGANVAQAHDFGPPVGTRLPAVQAADQSNTQRTFDALKGSNGLVLVITRSADWCPFCQSQLIGLEGVRAQIEQRGWRVAAITTDTVAKNARFVARRDIGYPILADPEFRLVDALDLRDPNYPPGNRRHGIPVPTIFFVTPDQVIAARLGEENYRVRPEPELVIETIDNLGG